MQKHRGSLVWLIAWLSLGSAVWLASPRSAQNHAKANAPSLSAISGKKLSQDDRLSSSGNRLKSIERVEVGQRVATGISQEIRDLAIGDPLAVPQWDRLDHQIDSQTWRKLTLVMHTPQGDRFDITLLRPIGWLESCNARVGSSIHLVVSEQGLDGLADVLGIEPCPSISSGVGRVVTGTFTHVRGGILRIRLFGLAEPLGVTSNHSIYSADRLDFVPAGELRVGETLRNIDGDVRIESIEQLGSEERVYNLEIHGEHVFRVASSGVLVHNSSGVKAPIKPDVKTGAGYGVSDPPVRIIGNWTDNDLKQALLGHPPRGLGSPDLHHAGQMPGAGIHEVIPSQHRGNKALHPNKYNQGVTDEMREQDRQLHWWYRAREQGADQRLPNWIYDE
jgi:hypothetical protein